MQFVVKQAAAKNFENWDLASRPLPVGTPLAHILYHQTDVLW